MNQLIEPREARQHIAKNLPSIPAINCPLEKCAGRILRQDIEADRAFPPFNRSMMDGYALRASETKPETTFKITGCASAGSEQMINSEELHSCVEIMTGAMLPLKTDSVVPYEDTERTGESQIRITGKSPVREGDFVHKKGSDFDKGMVLLSSGRLLGSREVAAAATCGYSTLKVSKQPRIAIACSGDELVEVDQQPAPQQIRRSNDFCIETGLARAQIHAATRVHLTDAPEATRINLTELISNNEFVIISGGISMGKKDFIPDILYQQGLSCHFHGVAQKPGKPMGFWSNENTAVFALPGNPISTLTCLHHYVLPAILQAMGLSKEPSLQKITLSESQKVREDLSVFLPVTLGPENSAIPCPTQNSGDLIRILQSDGYIIAPPGVAIAEKGKSYTFHNWH